MEQIKLNTIPSGVPSVCHISQFDNTSRIIRCHLFNGADPLTLTGSETIRLFVRKSNNSRAEFEIESTSGTFIDLVITSEMSDITGDSECKFQITDSEKTIGTLNFKMIVEPDAYGDSLKTRSISGPIATFETDLAEDLIKLDVDLEPIQDLHGYDYPWPAGGGKNIAHFSEDTVHELRNITAEYIDDNGIILSVAGTYSLGIYKFPCTIGKTYTVSFRGICTANYKRIYISKTTPVQTSGNAYGIIYLSGTEELYKTLTFTAETDTIYVGFYIGTSGDPGTATINDFMIEEGSTATLFAPYENICPISGHDSAMLSRIGKNWLNLNRTNIITNSGLYPSTTRTFSENDIWIGISRNNYFNNARIISYSIDSNKITVLTTAGGYGVGFPVRCKPSTAYKMSNKEGYSIGIGFFDVDGNYLSDTTGSTFTTPNNCVWILVVFSGTANVEISYTDPQLELGSTATDYEPYVSEPTPVTVQFGQTVYKGKLYSEQRKVLVTHVGMDLGYFTWNHYVTETRNYFYSNQPPPISPKGTVGPEINDDIMSIYSCEKYADVVNGYTCSWIHSGFTLPATTKRLYIYDEAMENEDAAAFKTRVTGQQFVYEIAEPFYIDLTQVQTASIDSTPVASFETTLAMPLNTSEYSFSCSQAEGTPTPDSPIPIAGVSEITAFRTGKNLLDKNSYKFANSGNIIWGGAVGGYADGSFILPSGTYTLSSPVSCAGLYISDNEKSIKIVYNKTSITFTLDKTTPIRMMLYINGVTKDDILSYNYQLELGSTATPYEPYSGESITVSLGGTYYGGKLVQSEDGSRKIVLSYAQLVLSSANANIINRVNANKYRVFNADCGAKITGSDYADIKCNKMSSQTGTTNDNRCYINSTGDIRMNFASEYDTVADMIAAIESITVVYPLETPIEIDLPDGDPLTTLAGENNVYCNTGDTALTYYYNMVADPIRIPALAGTNNVYSDAGDVDVEYYTTLEGGND